MKNNIPKYYDRGIYEPLKIILAYNLDFMLGNVLKYILRSKYKGYEIEDLEKAQDYLTRYIEYKKEEAK